MYNRATVPYPKGTVGRLRNTAYEGSQTIYRAHFFFYYFLDKVTPDACWRRAGTYHADQEGKEAKQRATAAHAEVQRPTVLLRPLARVVKAKPESLDLILGALRRS